MGPLLQLQAHAQQSASAVRRAQALTLRTEYRRCSRSLRAAWCFLLPLLRAPLRVHLRARHCACSTRNCLLHLSQRLSQSLYRNGPCSLRASRLGRGDGGRCARLELFERWSVAHAAGKVPICSAMSLAVGSLCVLMRQYTMLAVAYQSTKALQKVEGKVEDLQVRAPAFDHASSMSGRSSRAGNFS